MNDDGFSWEWVECDTPGCLEPVRYRLWRGDELLACQCERHHDEWWQAHDLTLHEVAELVAALDTSPRHR